MIGCPFNTLFNNSLENSYHKQTPALGTQQIGIYSQWFLPGKYKGVIGGDKGWGGGCEKKATNVCLMILTFVESPASELAEEELTTFLQPFQ